MIDGIPGEPEGPHKAGRGRVSSQSCLPRLMAQLEVTRRGTGKEGLRRHQVRAGRWGGRRGLA